MRTGGSFSSAFNFDCDRSVKYSAANGSAATAYLTALFAGDSNDRHAFGTDPVFLRSSGLYQPDLTYSVGDYYNTSSDASEVSVTGAPYGFFYRGLQVGGWVGMW